MKIRVNDNVLVTKGRDRGRTGRVQRIFADRGRLMVEGVNIVSRHMKPNPQLRQTGIVQKELSVPIANVMLICPISNEPTRVGMRRLADGSKARTCKDCEEVIE